jgi:GT2 family glycosyltransferase
MSKLTPLVSIITVNYNQTALTCQLLESLRRQSYRNIEVFVVDNDSRDRTMATEIMEHYPEVQFIQSPENLGFAGGNNLAVAKAKGDLLFFINNDAEVTAETLPTMLTFLAARPLVGALSPMLCYFNDAPTEQADLIQYVGMTQVNPVTARNKTVGNKVLNYNQYTLPMPTAYAHGAAMMVRREVLEKAGTMDNSFFLYYEELDWGERIRRAGYQIWCEPRAKVYHKESVTVGADSAFKTFYINRNRIYFMRRNFGGVRLMPFLLFLTFVTIPKNTLVYVLKRKKEHLASFWRAIRWNWQDAKHNKHTKTTENTPNHTPKLSV